MHFLYLRFDFNTVHVDYVIFDVNAFYYKFNNDLLPNLQEDSNLFVTYFHFKFINHYGTFHPDVFRPYMD